MNYFSYKLEHDFGLAPNPFGGYCTLAVCKSDIRKNKRLNAGDWIIGIGSKKLHTLNHLIYAMQVSEKLSFDEYWNDARFQYKKPVVNGSLVMMYGDNIYHTDKETHEWLQEDSAHSLANGIVNQEHLLSDTGGEKVIIGEIFYYFGNAAILIPSEFEEVCTKGRATKSSSIPIETANRFIEWLQKSYTIGIHGDPINWKNHK